MILHDYELSAHAYAARLLLALLGVDHRKVGVDVFPGGELASDAFRALNPRGILPVLVDGAVTACGVQAALVHLAETCAEPASWLPADPALRAEVFGWLAFSGEELAAAEAARMESILGLPAPWPDAAARAVAGFRILEDRLVRRRIAGSGWLVGNAPTLADIACFPAVALSIDFGVGLEDFPLLRAWTRRIRALPGFVAMPGIPEFL